MVLREPSEQPVGTPRIEDLLDIILHNSASDLHLTTGSHPVMRLHGRLIRLENFPALTGDHVREIMYAILTQRQREKFEENLELDLSYSLPGKARFRVNVFFQRDQMAAAFRMIPVEIRSLADLGIPPRVAEFALMQRGLVLVTGPTGQGKTTTLASLVDIINTERDVHIVTIEDPIEFLHRHKRSIVNQREVGTDTWSFPNALRHVLRQDPDVILIGEMRDLETIQIALTAAETGHLVFATLHTQDAAQTVDRIIDSFPPHQQEQVRTQLSGALQGIVTQQLLPVKDGSSRVAGVEILVATPAVRNLIREGKTHQIYSTLQAGGQYGMQTMDQSLADLVKMGKISHELAAERCHDSTVLEQLLSTR